MKNANITSLRGIAIVVIILYHINEFLFPAGFLMVNLFLVLSGFLLSKSYLKQEIVNFSKVKNRVVHLAKHVYPMIVLVLLFLFLFNYFVFFKVKWDAIFGFAFLSNIHYILSNVSYFDAFLFVSPFKHLWFIALLVQCNFIFYVLFRIGYEKNRPKKFVLLLLFVIVCSFIASLSLYHPEHVSRVYYGLDTRIYSFMIGALGGVLTKKTLNLKQQKYQWLLYICIFALFAAIFYFDVRNTFLFRGGFLLVDIICLCIVILIYSLPEIKIIANPIFKVIGEFSFFLYIWHYPILTLTSKPIEIGFLVGKDMFIKLFWMLIILGILFVFLKKIYSKINSIAKLLLTVLLVVFSLIQFSFPISSKLLVNEENIQQNAFIPTRKISSYVVNTLVYPQHLTKQIANIRKQKTSTTKPSVQKVSKVPALKTTYKNLILVGDSTSIILGGGIRQRMPSAIIDARVSRHYWDAPKIMEKYKKYDNKDTAVLIQLGANSKVQARHFDPTIQSMPNSDVYVLLIGADSALFNENNKVMVELAKKFKNVHLIQMREFYKKHPQLIYEDGVHIKEIGEATITDFVLKHLVR